MIHGYDTSKKKVKNNLWRQVGMVFQYPEMQFFEENVFKEVAFGPSNMELSTNEVSQRVLDVYKRQHVLWLYNKVSAEFLYNMLNVW